MGLDSTPRLPRLSASPRPVRDQGFKRWMPDGSTLDSERAVIWFEYVRFS